MTLYAQVDEGAIESFPMSYGSGNWTVQVPASGHTSNLTMWVVAWDWGMNMARGGYVTDLIGPTTSQPPPPPNLVITLIIMASVAAVIVVVGVFVLRRRE